MTSSTKSSKHSAKPVWFITGCSNGFGRQIAKHVLELGLCPLKSSSCHKFSDACQVGVLAARSSEFSMLRIGRNYEVELQWANQKYIASDIELTLRGFGCNGSSLLGRIASSVRDNQPFRLQASYCWRGLHHFCKRYKETYAWLGATSATRLVGLGVFDRKSNQCFWRCERSKLGQG